MIKNSILIGLLLLPISLQFSLKCAEHPNPNQFDVDAQTRPVPSLLTRTLVHINKLLISTIPEEALEAEQFLLAVEHNNIVIELAQATKDAFIEQHRILLLSLLADKVLPDYAIIDQNNVSLIAFSPDSQYVFTASDNTIFVRHIKSGLCMGALIGHKHSISALAINTTGTQALTADASGKIIHRDLKSGHILGICNHTINGHGARVTHVTFSPCGMFAISIGQTSARLWSLRDYTATSFDQHTVAHAVFDPTENLIHTNSGLDTTVQIFNYVTTPINIEADAEIDAKPANATVTIINPISTANLPHVASEQYGPYCIHTCYSRTQASARIITLQNLLKPTAYQRFMLHFCGWTRYAVTSNGRYLAAATTTDGIWLYDMQSPESAIHLNGFTPWIESIAISPNGQYIVAILNDKKVVLWDLDSFLNSFNLRDLANLVRAKLAPQAAKKISLFD